MVNIKMNPPSCYSDVKDIISVSIFSYSPEDLCSILSIETKLGQIIPEDHMDEIGLYDAIVSVNDEYDEELMEEIHKTLEYYIDVMIKNISSEVVLFSDDNYEMEFEFDKEYLWAEKYYFDMFGLWSPRMIYIYYNCNYGDVLFLEESNFDIYVFCKMHDEEINFNECKNCPFLLKKNGQFLCKYLNLIQNTC